MEAVVSFSYYLISVLLLSSLQIPVLSQQVSASLSSSSSSLDEIIKRSQNEEEIFEICDDSNSTILFIDVNRISKINWCRRRQTYNILLTNDEILTRQIDQYFCNDENEFFRNSTDCAGNPGTKNYYVITDSPNKYVSSKFNFTELKGSKNSEIKIAVIEHSYIPEELEKIMKYMNTKSTKEPVNRTLMGRLKREITDIPMNYQVTVLFAKSALHGDVRIPIKLIQNCDYLHFILRGNYRTCKLQKPNGEILDILRQADNIRKPVYGMNFLATIPIKEDNVFGESAWMIITNGNNYNLTVLAVRKPSISSDVDNQTAIMKSSNDDRVKYYHRRAIDNVNDGWKPIVPPNSRSEYRRRNENDIPPPFEQDAQSNLFKPFISQQQQQPTLRIEASSKNKLYALPGEITALVFDVTYFGSVTMLVYFSCSYQSTHQCEVEPKWTMLYPEKVMPISVTVKAEINEGSTSIVSLNAQGFVSWTYKAYLYIGKQISDRSKPDINHEVSGNCDDADKGSTCNSKQWSVDITAHDDGSGLLKLFSEPPGLIFTSEFIAGTKDVVHGRYTASCCNPKVDITALDVAGNQYTKTLDIQHQTLSLLEWIAIVLGVLLLLLLASIIAYFIVKWRKKRQERGLFRN